MSLCLCFNLFPFSIHQYSLPFFGPLVFLFCLLPLLSLLLFIYEIPLSLCHTLCSLPLSFHMCLLFSLFILPILLCLYFIPVYATYIVPLPLFCNHYFHSTASTATPYPLPPFLLSFLGYDCCFLFAFD